MKFDGIQHLNSYSLKYDVGSLKSVGPVAPLPFLSAKERKKIHEKPLALTLNEITYLMFQFYMMYIKGYYYCFIYIYIIIIFIIYSHFFLLKIFSRTFG